MLTAALSTPVEALLYVLLVLVVLAFAIFLGRCIHAAEEPLEPPVEPESPEDLDDWLAAEEPLREFKVYRRPTASVTVDGGGS